MSKAVLRDKNTCENCGNVVDVRFCSYCGQENVETKKSFHYLFTHFIEDLVHYDNGFWKAIKHLLFSPYILTIEYLKGKRKKYVAPVKLFIFMNFLCFFLTGMLSYETSSVLKVNETPNKPNEIQVDQDAISNANFFTKKISDLDKKYTTQEIFEKIGEKIKYYFPKVVFAYMPLFAFFLWLFHNKKKWWYFDHGIFTFHFFSSVMLLISIHAIVDFLLFKLGLSTIQDLLNFALVVYIIYLFYKSHKQLFYETKMMSFFKASAILFVNSITMAIFALLLLIISIMYIK
ncbi:DUF3667 domain-containing protein [Flavobacterium urocaniciphilum]|uniref:DUF3667 domain-containing protein n=1 Tax=Flavobacterium urocaniciphilum TaxID=1299341 RepID=A0A1H8ZBF8_9FLAO|nr:DUF3667 domain-containing protein [Flavobacterium urocaniciphilum]SEP61765.1 Protein of unknown function [Flavobacterium urocaniciphilum]